MSNAKLVVRPIVRTLAAMAAAALVLAVVLHLSIRPDSHAANQEQYTVYSAYIEDGLTGESHSLGDPRGLVAIFASSTMSTMWVEPRSKVEEIRQLFLSIANLRRRGTSIRVPLLYDFFCANLRSHKFERRFTLHSRYATLESAADYFETNARHNYPGSYGFLSLSSIAFNRDMTEALFYAEHVCGMCGGGEYVLMKKTHGTWTVAERFSTWVS